jgi:RsiW-degrading membrane proteinase PrsW (M82 family)
MHILNTVLLAILGGVLPALAWLYFWLREDAHPEPKKLIWRTFLFGMYAVPFVLCFQYVIDLLKPNQGIQSLFYTNYPLALLVIILSAASEEYFKYRAAYFGGLKTKDNDEPIDPMIYMITAALGFAALENTLFMFSILSEDSTTAIITGNMRFIGATMLHVATSAIIGIFASFSFYKSKKIKRKNFIIGFIIAVALHTVFNYFILRSEKFTVVSFAIVWITIVVIIMIFEKVKKIILKRKNK